MQIIGVSPLKTGHAGPEDAPRTDTERRLAAIWARAFGRDQIGRHDDFFDLGGSSLLAARIAAQVEEAFGARFPITTLFHAPTVALLADRLDGGLTWSSLVPLQPDGDRPPLFCVHGSGGHVLRLRTLAKHLAPDQPFYGLESRSMGGDRPPATSVEEMAADYLPEVRRLQPQGPYYLGGYSFGGSVALEMAKRLQAEGETVALLVLLDCHTPIADRPSRARLVQMALWGATVRMKRLRTSPAGYAQQAARRLRARLGDAVTRHVAPGPDERPSGDAEPPTMQTACRLAAMTYRATPYAGEAVLLQSRLQRKHPSDPRWWSDLVGTLIVREVPGTHGTMLEAPHVRETAAALRDELAAAQARFAPAV